MSVVPEIEEFLSHLDTVFSLAKYPEGSRVTGFIFCPAGIETSVTYQWIFCLNIIIMLNVYALRVWESFYNPDMLMNFEFGISLLLNELFVFSFSGHRKASPGEVEGSSISP